jgi:hypothetical protein
MKVSGFTVIRNGILMGYPVLQSIRSLLPLVDEFVVGVGQSDDATKDMILSIGDPKIRIFDSFWDPAKTRGGLVLSEKTNEALALCKYDWCFYLQADEVVHEMDLPVIWRAMETNLKDERVQGLLFQYLHFYGSYSTLATSRRWYRNEVRIVRRSAGLVSHNDAQGFRTKEGEKPWVKPSGGRIFHYGWVKPPAQMGEKTKLLSRWWHGNKRDREFRTFKGSHPAVMRDLVASQTWSFDHRRTLADWHFKDLRLAASDALEGAFHFRLGAYKPYRLVK